MSDKNEKTNEWNLYDSAMDKIETNVDFDNPSAQQLMDAFNATTPKLLELCERREFLTYFFMGPNEPSLLTPKQAMDFKLTFGTNNFPANGLQTYMDWRDGGTNNYRHAFPYPVVNGNTGSIRSGEWKIGYIDDISNDIRDFVDNQASYGSWLDPVLNNGYGWIEALKNEDLLKSEHFKALMAKLSGLFATGKFLVYYELVVKVDMMKVMPSGSMFEFDPYTGIINIKTTTGGKINCLYSDLATKYANTEEAKQLLVSNAPTALPGEHKFFCTLCQMAGNSYDRNAVPSSYKNEPITSYWDFTPIRQSGKRPYDTFATEPPLFVKTKFMYNIKQLAIMFFKQTRVINNGTTSYKEYWNGAVLKISDVDTRTCPFFYVLHVDFDSVRESRNPFAGAQLTELNNAINNVLAEREKLQNTLFSLFKHVTVNKSCSATVVNASTAIFQEGSTNNKVISNAACTMDSVDGEPEEGKEEQTKEKTPKTPPKDDEPIDESVIENTFSMSNRSSIEDTAAGTSASVAAGAEGREGPPGKDCSLTTPGIMAFVVIVSVLLGLLIIWNIFTTIRLKNQLKGYTKIDQLVPA